MNLNRIKEVTENGITSYTVTSIIESQIKLEQQNNEIIETTIQNDKTDDDDNDEDDEDNEDNDSIPPEKQQKIDKTNCEDIMSLITMPTIREKESKKVGEQILDLLSKQTSKEKSLAERFRSHGGAQVMEFCPHGTRIDCNKLNCPIKCKKLHFKKIIQLHTDETLGDCSFLNTCFHMDTCK